jgi:hypothetical protein
MICKYFDATGCSYVAQFGVPRPRGYMRIQLEQFFWMAEACSFDEEGVIVAMPTVEELRATIEARWCEEVHAAGEPADAESTMSTVTAEPDGAAPERCDEAPHVLASELVRNDPEAKDVSDA